MSSEYKQKTENTARILSDITDKLSSGEYAAGDRLPPEKELVEKYGVNVYNIRKAIKALKDQGILYSVPKVGVFVVRDIHLTTRDKTLSYRPDIKKVFIRLATKSDLSVQKQFWNKMEQKYPPFSAVYIRDGETGIENADIFEYEAFSQSYFDRKNTFLDICKYFSWAFPCMNNAPDPYRLPLYSMPGLLMVNLKMLHDLHIEQEHYHSYDEQNTYLENILSASQRHGLSLPGTSLSPIMSMGTGKVQAMFGLFCDSSATLKDFRSQFSKDICRATELWKRYPSNYPDIAVPALIDFLAGKTPFYRGSAVDFMKIKELNPSFPTAVSMLFSEDDTYNRQMITLSLRNNLEYSAETLHSLRIMMSDEMQSLFVEMGALPVNLQNYKGSPLESFDLENKLAKPLLFRTKEECYICTNLLNSELMQVMLGQKEQETAEYDIFMLAKTHIKMCLDRMSEKEKSTWHETYKQT